MKEVQNLKWPENRVQLMLASLDTLQTWYALQNPKDMVYVANTPEFVRFWHFAYVLPTRFYRKLLKIKHFAFGSRSERMAA